MKKVEFTDEQLVWHLQNNVFENLTHKTIWGIIDTVHNYNEGLLSEDDLINENTDCTVGEMLEDLKLL